MVRSRVAAVATTVSQPIASQPYATLPLGNADARRLGSKAFRSCWVPKKRRRAASVLAATCSLAGAAVGQQVEPAVSKDARRQSSALRRYTKKNKTRRRRTRGRRP
ncbi:unnamed protein product [Sphagnum jensenii]|uniref:Uncharacterized protein n=1 Tax=Sphagnum jensenii TaxID=128206 RepID=A0ABP1A8P2_9BRYO